LSVRARGFESHPLRLHISFRKSLSAEGFRIFLPLLIS